MSSFQNGLTLLFRNVKEWSETKSNARTSIAAFISSKDCWMKQSLRRQPHNENVTLVRNEINPLSRSLPAVLDEKSDDIIGCWSSHSTVIGQDLAQTCRKTPSQTMLRSFTFAAQHNHMLVWSSKKPNNVNQAS